jgi:type IV pilus assembly protein PilW
MHAERHIVRNSPNNPRRRIAGITLIELMVALSIGSFLMIGAVTVFMQSRTTFRVSEAVSRLQENARFVLDALEPDLRMAHFWGLTSRTVKIVGRATPLDPIPPGLGVANDCGVNWSINLNNEIGGTNNGYAWACPAFGGAAQAGADTLVIRRVSEDPIVAPLAGVIYVQSARFRDGELFTGPAIPPGFLAGTSETHQLIVDGYYVSPNSTLDTPGNPIPSLRMKTLIGGGAGGPRIIDQEVLPGVEDMQVQFGVDTDLVDTPNRGAIDRYVNPGDPIITPGNPGFLPDAQILAVRLWLRIRAERVENGFVDTTNYVYADRNQAALNDQFRRSVVTKTVYIRNARGPR